MQIELKQQIATEAAEYAKAHKLSNNDVAKATGVNTGYISNIFRGQFSNEVSGKDVPIGDTHFYKLAHWAGVAVKKQYWKIMQTLQFKEILAVLLDSKKHPRAFMIINDTGAGKTTAINVFTNKMPQHTYRITVGDSYKIEDIVSELAEKIGVDKSQFTKHMRYFGLKNRIDLITDKLIEIKHSGGQPVIILDEAENLKPNVLRTVKELYDAIIEHCSIVLIGTEQILEAMLNKRNRNRIAVPQIYRRFKAGTRVITPINKARDFTPFYNEYGMNKTFGELVNVLADNYGELHDYLEPVMRYADVNGQKFTMELFKMYHNIQN